MNDREVAPAPAASSTWPNSPVAVVKAQESTGPQTEFREEAVQPAGDAKANNTDSAAHADVSTTNNEITASLTPTPVAIFGALALIVAGFLLRIVLKSFVGRRHRIAVDHHDFDWFNDPLRVSCQIINSSMNATVSPTTYNAQPEQSHPNPALFVFRRSMMNG